MPLKVCVVTEEFAGLNKSGGIGAACRGLSELLASNGYDVDVIITDMEYSNQQSNVFDDNHVKKFLFLRDICELRTDIFMPVDAITKSYAVYLYLNDAKYDIVHFNEWMGSGFYTAMARRQGLFNSIVVTNTHGSSEWVRLHNKYTPSLEDLELEAIERSQIEQSDYVVSPSQYLLDWYRSRGLTLPANSCKGWVLPQWIDHWPTDSTPFSTKPAPVQIRELIFFGRHEVRKGFELFIAAVARFPRHIQPDLTFIGRFDRIRGEFSGSYALRKLSGYNGRIRFIDNLNQQEAMQRISTADGALCVMPSLIENSPCVVGECLTLGVPFIATAVGGTPELIAPSSHDACLAKPEVTSLSEKLLTALNNGQPKIVSNIVAEDVRAKWLEWHKDVIRSKQRKRTANHESPQVSICITHYERPQLLDRALRKIMEQTYDNIEVILVDDGSKSTSAQAYLNEIEIGSWRYPVKLIRSDNRYLGAARNLAASHANGDYILFHDDDNYAEPTEIETFVTAAVNSGCDILTSAYWIIRDEQDQIPRKIEYYPIGVGGTFSFFRNRFGDANALVRRSFFEKIGGFTELRGVGWEDWELFLRAYLSGAKMGVVPLPLFNYRVSHDGMLATGDLTVNYERIFSLIDKLQPSLNSEIFRYTCSNWLQEQSRAKLINDVEGLPGGDIHRELMDLPPASTEARAALSDLAFILGRIPDAIEIGLSAFGRRNNLALIAAALDEQPVIKYGEKTYFRPNLSTSEVVYGLRGWAFNRRGEIHLPDRLRINGSVFGVTAVQVNDRPDVNKSFGIDARSSVGFFCFAEHRRSWNFLQRYATIRSLKSWRIKVALPLLRKVRVNVDQLVPLQKIDIPMEISETWRRITVESSVDGVISLVAERTGFIIGTIIQGRKAIFKNTNCYNGKLYILVSEGAMIDLISEATKTDNHVSDSRKG